MIPGARACDVEQLSFGVVHFLKVAVVTNRFDTLLQRDDFVVASHDRNSTKLQPLCQVHRADRYALLLDRHLLVENLKINYG